MVNKKYNYSGELHQSGNNTELTDEFRKLQPEIADASRKMDDIIAGVSTCTDTIQQFSNQLK